MTPDISWRKGLCGVCPAGCWVEVGTYEGRLVDIREDPDSALGTICKRGMHAAEIVYSPHRLKHPMIRRGPKGGYDFESISWDDAYGLIVERLEDVRRESGPEAVTVYTGRGAQELSLCDMFQPKGVEVSSASNVLFPFGSPNTMGVGALCYVSLHMIAPHVTMGRMQPNMFADIENAEMVVVWGTNPATDSPPVEMESLMVASGRGADIVVVDPRRTETVKDTKAQWVPIRPGTDCALALGMLNVVVEEDLYDDDFAENWCHGFEQLATYVNHFPPDLVESTTGVPAQTVRDVARRICRANGASLLMYTGLEYSNCGVQSARAVLTLFSLCGQLDVPGGIGLTMLDSTFPINRSCNQENPDIDRAVARREFPVYSDYRGESHAIGLVDSVLRGEPYRIRAMLIQGASILTSWPQVSIWREALSSLDFLVCIDRQMTADAAYADLILPATTMFENLSYMVYGPLFRVRERVIEPVGESRNDYLIMAELARRLGYGHLFPQSEEEMVEFALQGSGYSLKDVRESGGWVRIPAAMMEYKKWQKGGLRHDGAPGFDTPTGKFEIYSTVLEDYGYEPLPKYVEPTEGPVGSPDLASEYPLVFNSGARPHNDFRSQHHGIESLVRENPEPTVDINVRDAKERGIASGDLVEVRTPRGRVTFRARVTEDITEGAVECVMGGGTPVGPRAWREWNVNELTDLGNFDRISGFPVYKALLCEVTLLEAGGRTDGCQLRPEVIGQPADDAKEEGRTLRPDTVYLDNNATTRIAEEVRRAMLPYLGVEYGNPSSIHVSGRNAKDAIDRARRQVAGLINARPREIIFTGGGSESDNLALKGTMLAGELAGKSIVTSAVEHPAVLRTCESLKKLGCEVVVLPVDGDGMVVQWEMKEAMEGDVFLVSIMMANNEVGTVMPISELCRIAHEKGALFHTDAVQAVGKMEVDVRELGVDLLSVSGHKMHGPKGIGALFVRKGVGLEPVIHGGNQERGLRAGTENVAAIVGLGKAAELAAGHLSDGGEMTKLRDELEKGINALVPEARLNGHAVLRLPNTLNVSLPGVRGESVVIAMDRYGVALSSGSACKSGSPEPTHVLLAMGRSNEEAHSSLRFSLSRYTTADEIRRALEALKLVLEEKKKVRLIPCK